MFKLVDGKLVREIDATVEGPLTIDSNFRVRSDGMYWALYWDRTTVNKGTRPNRVIACKRKLAVKVSERQPTGNDLLAAFAADSLSPADQSLLLANIGRARI